MRLLEALNAHSGAALAAFMTEDVVVEDLGWGRVYPAGSQTNPIELLATMSSDYTATWTSNSSQGDVHSLEWEITGHQDGPIEDLGITATGREFVIRGVLVVVTEQGRIKSVRAYWSLVALLTQLGVRLAAPIDWGLSLWSGDDAELSAA
jgi:hypothetical protein